MDIPRRRDESRLRVAAQGFNLDFRDTFRSDDMQPCVKLETDGIVETDEMIRLLECRGASNPRISFGAGSAAEGVQRHFMIEFDDGDGRRRYVTGFHAFPSDEHENGWTRFALGANDRAFDLLSDIAQELGGRLYDQRTNLLTEIEPRTAYAMAM